MIETKTKKKLMWVAGLIGVFVMLVASNAQAQVKVGDNPTTIDARSVLELESDDQALYLPRLTTTQRNNVSGWKEGMVLYNTTDGCIQIYDGSTWECVGSDLNGIYSSSGDLTSTVDVKQANFDMTFTNTGGDFKVDTTTLVVDASENRVGIGTAVPSYGLELRGEPLQLHADNFNASAGLTFEGQTAQGVGSGLLLRGKHSASSIVVAGGMDIYKESATLSDFGYALRFFSREHGQDMLEKMRITGDGDVGIGVSDPDAKLEVAGQVKITGGTPGAGKVLTSDANGLATWEDGADVNTVSVTNITAAYTVVDADHAIFNTSTAGSTVAITLPNPASHSGRIIKIINTNSTAGGTVTFAGSHLPQGTISQLNPQASGSLISNGTNWYWYSSF